MFRLVWSLVIRHPRAVILGWLVLAVGLYYLAPPWDQITKDDDLGLLPAGSPSVIGQALLERGFPHDASSSDLVLIHERKNGRLTRDDFRFVDDEASRLSRLAREHPELGLNKIETYRTPLIGSRLIGSRAGGSDQVVLSIVSLNSTYPSRRTESAVGQILEWLNSKELVPPPGLSREVSGSAAVGYDTNKATVESIQNTTHTTIALVMGQCASPPIPDMSRSGRGNRPLSTPSPASRSFQGTTPSRSRASTRWKKSARRPARHGALPAASRSERDRLRGCHFGGQRPEAGDHERPAPHVCSGHVRGLLRPGWLAAPTGNQPLSHRHGGAGIPGCAGAY